MWIIKISIASYVLEYVCDKINVSVVGDQTNYISVLNDNVAQHLGVDLTRNQCDNY